MGTKFEAFLPSRLPSKYKSLAVPARILLHPYTSLLGISAKLKAGTVGRTIPQHAPADGNHPQSRWFADWRHDAATLAAPRQDKAKLGPLSASTCDQSTDARRSRARRKVQAFACFRRYGGAGFKTFRAFDRHLPRWAFGFQPATPGPEDLNLRLLSCSLCDTCEAPPLEC